MRIPDQSKDRAFRQLGIWSDIDYGDQSRSWWYAAEHLRRCLLMASAIASPRSAHCNSSTISAAAARAFEWWVTTDPQNQWWWMQIGVPRVVAKFLLLANPSPRLIGLARPLLSRTPLYNCTAATDRAMIANSTDGCRCVTGCAGTTSPGTWTGCNRIWGATVHVLVGVIDRDRERLATAFGMAHSAITMVSRDDGGIQADASFHQHGRQLYSGWGYGAIFTTNLLVLEAYAAGTDFAMPESAWSTFARLVLDGQAAATRQANFDFLACGRLFTYFVQRDRWGVNQGHYHYFAAFSPYELAFPRFVAPFDTPIGVLFAPLLGGVSRSRPRAAEFTAFEQRLTGKLPDPASHSHFYDSDYTAHHRPGYAVFVHMLSSRTLATECVNSENKRGRMLADGTTTVYGSGGQYTGVFPLLNWTVLPGTTEVQSAEQDAESPDHGCANIKAGNVHRDFVGGLADGGFGVSVMDFARRKFVAVGATSAITEGSAASSRPQSIQGCVHATAPTAGMHCDTGPRKSATLRNSLISDPEACRSLCCGDSRCSCWTWTSYERMDISTCYKGTFEIFELSECEDPSTLGPSNGFLAGVSTVP